MYLFYSVNLMPDKKKKKLIIVVSSPSGAGKTTICKRLLKADRKLRLSISDTTRSPRQNEVNSKDYNFISMNQFKNKIKDNKYIEYAKVFGNYYGSPKEYIIKSHNAGYDVLFDIDWQGAEQLKSSHFNHLVLIFIVPPSKDEIYNRLSLRSSESGDKKESINKRMSLYETEMSHKDEYDHVVINNDLDQCVDEIISIIDDERNTN